MTSLTIFFSQDELNLKVPGSARIEIREWRHYDQVDYVLEIVIMGEDGKSSFVYKDALVVNEEDVFTQAQISIEALQRSVSKAEEMIGIIFPFQLLIKEKEYDIVNDLRE